MTNEQLVEKIRNGYSATENMRLLYESNLPLIKRYIKKYAAYEDMEDLLQEAYFGLWEATKHYETSENVLFMSYASYWIKQAVQRYIEKCGSTVRIPSYKKQIIIRYKKTVQALEQKLSRTPTDKEIADIMGVPLDLLLDLKTQLQGVISLDTPLSDDNDLRLCDTVQADFCMEDDIIDNIYAEYSKRELWSIVKDFTTEEENKIIKEYFAKNKTMARIAKDEGVSIERIRTIKEKGLRKLRLGKAKRKLMEKFEISEASVYRTGKANFDRHNFTSMVEFIAIRRVELQNEYQERKKHIEKNISAAKRKDV